MDRMTLQAAMSGNLEAQKRLSTAHQGLNTAPAAAKKQIAARKPAAHGKFANLVLKDGNIDEAEFDRIMLESTNKERAKR